MYENLKPIEQIVENTLDQARAIVWNACDNVAQIVTKKQALEVLRTSPQGARLKVCSTSRMVIITTKLERLSDA